MTMQRTPIRPHISRLPHLSHLFSGVLCPLLLAALLGGCTAPLNSVRIERLASAPAAPNVIEPSALALGLRISEDGSGLEPDSLARLNRLLTEQGRLNAQTLVITPLNERGLQLAPRLASALVAAGANMPEQQPLPADAARIDSARAGGWDLELQSAALVLRVPACAVARPGDWMVQPFAGVGQLGCANRANIAAMTSDVRDLRRPRTLAAADGRTAAGAVERYQSGQLRELIDINFEED